MSDDQICSGPVVNLTTHESLKFPVFVLYPSPPLPLLLVVVQHVILYYQEEL